MNKAIACLGLLVLIIATHQAAYSQDAKPTFRVEINVTAEETIKSEIASCLNRELRSFSDIVLTDSEPHIRISGVAVTNAFPSGYAKGYTLSVAFLNPYLNPSRTFYSLATAVKKSQRG